MNKSELIDAIATQADLSKAAAGPLDAAVEAIKGRTERAAPSPSSVSAPSPRASAPPARAAIRAPAPP